MPHWHVYTADWDRPIPRAEAAPDRWLIVRARDLSPRA